MQLYELVCIIHPSLPENEAQKVIEGVRATLEKQEAQIVLQDFIGKRRLAYPLKGESFGYYVIFEYLLPASSSVQSITQTLALHESILRHIQVKKTEKSDDGKSRENALRARIQAVRQRKREKELQEDRATEQKLVQRKEELIQKTGEKQDLGKLDEKLDEILKRDIV